MYTDAARLCLYAIEYLDSEAAIPILKESGMDAPPEGDNFAKDFEIISSYGEDGYGIENGIYTEFLGGHAKAKISSALPIDIYAYESGAYFLDTSDRFIKSITRDGRKIEVIIPEKAEEFVYFARQIYYIDQNGVPHGGESPELSEGEFAMNLRIDGEDVKCTVYDKDFEPLREITLK